MKLEYKEFKKLLRNLYGKKTVEALIVLYRKSGNVNLYEKKY